MAFSWLFPGRLGDFDEAREHDISRIEDWAAHPLYFEDGRFIRDKLWGYFSLKYLHLH